jgi:hypothetical protein
MKPFYRTSHYLLSEEDLNAIDGLISALNLAITEIISRRALLQRDSTESPAQDDFNDQCYAVIAESYLNSDFKNQP